MASAAAVDDHPVFGIGIEARSAAPAEAVAAVEEGVAAVEFGLRGKGRREAVGILEMARERRVAGEEMVEIEGRGGFFGSGAM